jgi:DNA-binding PadR family transcriptional regulator
MPANTTLRPAVFHILLALAGQDLHGLGIAKAVEEATGGTMSLGPGTLYRSLKEMVRDGLIGEAPAPSIDEDTRRRFYQISSRGRDLVQTEAGRLAHIVDVARENRVLPETS